MHPDFPKSCQFCKSSHPRGVTRASFLRKPQPNICQIRVDQMKIRLQQTRCKVPVCESSTAEGAVCASGSIRRSQEWKRGCQSLLLPLFYAMSSSLAEQTRPADFLVLTLPLNKLHVLMKTEIFSVIIFPS